MPNLVSRPERPVPTAHFNPTDRINDLPVIASFELPDEKGCRPTRVVIVYRGTESMCPYICAYHSMGDDGRPSDSWSSGAYCDTMKDAIVEFNRRISTRVK